MGQYYVRVHIKRSVCYFDVGSAQPRYADVPKGRGVHPLKSIVSWVQTVVRQVGFYLPNMYKFDGKLSVVREEKDGGANGPRVVRQSTLGSYALSDNRWKHLSEKQTQKRNLLEI